MSKARAIFRVHALTAVYLALFSVRAGVLNSALSSPPPLPAVLAEWGWWRQSLRNRARVPTRRSPVGPPRARRSLGEKKRRREGCQDGGGGLGWPCGASEPASRRRQPSDPARCFGGRGWRSCDGDGDRCCRCRGVAERLAAQGFRGASPG